MSRTNQTGIPRSALFAWGRVFGDKVMSDQRDTDLILNAISFACVCMTDSCAKTGALRMLLTRFA